MSSEQQNRLAPTFSMIARALAHRNYRLFFFGQGISLIGTWMQQTALGWLAWRLTHSALLVGMVAFAGQISAPLAEPRGRCVGRPLESPSHIAHHAIALDDACGTDN